MRHIMLVGAIHAGKRGLLSALCGPAYVPRRAMAMEYCGPFINTPGEFLENPRFYHALITTSASCQTLLMLQSATAAQSLYPPGCAALFTRRVLGVITHAGQPDARVDRARRFLRMAGVRHMLEVDAASGLGLSALREALGLNELRETLGRNENAAGAHP